MSDVAESQSALEGRIVLRELFLIGPIRHMGEGSLGKHDVDIVQPRVERAVKVCYRSRPCEAQVPSNYSVVVVPRESFASVSAALDGWSKAMPPSHALAPVASSDAFGAWTTSILPLPPRDSGACV